MRNPHRVRKLLDWSVAGSLGVLGAEGCLIAGAHQRFRPAGPLRRHRYQDRGGILWSIDVVPEGRTSSVEIRCRFLPSRMELAGIRRWVLSQAVDGAWDLSIAPGKRKTA